MDAHEPPRQRERVDRRIAHHEEVEVAVAVVREAGQAQPQGLQVFTHFGIFEQRAGFAQTAHHHAADSVLVLDAQGSLGRGAHFGQLVLRRLGRQRAREQQPRREPVRPR
ncbi:MAG: hypothetical protein R6X15_10795, partial [Pseudomonadota bacterium]